MSEKRHYSYTSNWFNKIGRVLALVLSWSLNKSFGWMILHYIFGWFYVIYWLFEYSDLRALVLDNLIVR